MSITVASRAAGTGPALVALLGAASLTGCDRQSTGNAGALTASNVTEKVEQASTPADHYQLAEYFEARATMARREAVQERELRGKYERRWRSDNHSMGAQAGRHFEDLIEDNEQTESHYRAMADWHREMAQRGEHPTNADE